MVSRDGEIGWGLRIWETIIISQSSKLANNEL